MGETKGDAVQVLWKAGNTTVLRLPGRNFPAVAIPGDTLKSICNLAAECASRTNIDEVAELRDILASILAAYESGMASSGEPLPYPSRES